MSLQSTMPSRHHAVRRRLQHAIDTLRACSPITLRRLATGFIANPCPNCDRELRCDACEARSQLASICLNVASLVDGEI